MNYRCVFDSQVPNHIVIYSVALFIIISCFSALFIKYSLYVQYCAWAKNRIYSSSCMPGA